MKKILLLPALAIFMACNDSSKTDTTTGADTVKTLNTDVPPPDTNAIKPSGTNNDFVNTVANVGMMEVELGKLAQANASSKDVKDFGKMMETDHTAAGNKLHDIATADNISFPTTMSAEHQGHIDMLKAKTGADFDKAYMDMMVEGHTGMVDKFKDAIANNPDEKVKEFAKATLPTVQKHLDAAKKIRAKLK